MLTAPLEDAPEGVRIYGVDGPNILGVANAPHYSAKTYFVPKTAVPDFADPATMGILVKQVERVTGQTSYLNAPFIMGLLDFLAKERQARVESAP
jgi:hypothetical protein